MLPPKLAWLVPAHPTITPLWGYTVEWYNVVYLANSTEALRRIFLDINATFPTYEFIGYFNEENTPELNW